jgi:NAD-dependent SIR2 family protein deacetylase
MEAVFKHDIRGGPDAVIIIGTSSNVIGPGMLAYEFCLAAKTGKGRKCLWINKEPPSLGPKIDSLLDHVVL